jgi:hypothetical protein
MVSLFWKIAFHIVLIVCSRPACQPLSSRNSELLSKKSWDWLKNRERNFQVCSLIWPGLTLTTLSIDIQSYDSMHLYFVNITVNARLIKNRLFFVYGFSSFQCQYKTTSSLEIITQYLYKNKKTTSNIKTSRTINLAGRAFTL